MDGDLDRVVVTTGRVRVDTAELQDTALRLREAVSTLEHLSVVCGRVHDLVSESVGASRTSWGAHFCGGSGLLEPPESSGPLEGDAAARAARDACECVRFDLMRLTHAADSLAERLAFSSAILEAADSEARRVFASDASLPAPELSRGSWGVRFSSSDFFSPIARGILTTAFIADLGMTVAEFFTGSGGALVGPRCEWDARLLSGGIKRAGIAGHSGEGTRSAAFAASESALFIGSLLHGLSRGVEVTGPVLGHGRGRSVTDSSFSDLRKRVSAQLVAWFAAFSTGTADASTRRRLVSEYLAGGAIPFAAGLIAVSSVPRDLANAHPGVLPTREKLNAPLSSSPATPSSANPAPHPTPYTPSQLLGELSDLPSGGEKGGLKILRHETPLPGGGTHRSWSVVIRGTQNWGVGGSNPQDMLSNIQEVAGIESDQSRAVLAAMEMAGISPGEPVEFVGHSQGGIVAARLASDPAVGERYSVVSALTAGSPIATSSPPPGVGVLALENTRDIVPALDGARNAEGVVTVHFDGRGRSDGSPGVPAAHDMTTYQSLMADIESPLTKTRGNAALSEKDPSFAPVRAWEAARTEKLGLSDRTSTSELRYETRRILL